MYAIYTYQINATKEKIVDDIVRIVTGETDPYAAGFSDAIESPGTFIFDSAVSSGWEALALDNTLPTPLVIPTAPFTETVEFRRDATGFSAPTIQTAYGQVVRSKVTDTVDPGDADPMYKYALIFATDDGVGIRVFEKWIESTQIGLNEAPGGDHIYPWTIAGTAGNIHISSSPNHLFLNTLSAERRFGPFGALEHTRRSPWDTKANNFPPFGRFGFSGDTPTGPGLTREQDEPPFYHCRTLDGHLNVQVLGEPSYMQSIYTGSNTIAWTNQLSTVDANRNPSHALIPYGLTNYIVANEGGDVSSLTDSYLASTQQGGSFDEVLIGTDTYVIWQHDYSWQRMAVRKG